MFWCARAVQLYAGRHTGTLIRTHTLTHSAARPPLPSHTLTHTPASSLDNTVAWYENIQLPTSYLQSRIWVLHVIDYNAVNVASVIAIDMDNDGSIDVVSASQEGDTVAWYNNTDNDGTTWAKHQIATSANTPIVSSLFAVDVDADGDIDVLSGRPAVGRFVTGGSAETFLYSKFAWYNFSAC